MSALRPLCVNALRGPEYFTLFAALLKDNPPSPADGPMVSKLAKLGIVPGQPFDIAKTDPKVAAAINRVPKNALAEIQQTIERLPMMNGWAVAKTGTYGTDYLARAGVSTSASEQINRRTRSIRRRRWMLRANHSTPARPTT